MSKVRPNAAALAVGGEREIADSRSRARPAAPRGAVLVAIMIGLVFGAMACAAGLGGGGHRGTHVAVAAEQQAPPAAGHAHHAAHGVDAELASGIDAMSETGDRSTTTPTESHPGMACVISIDLRFPEPTALTASGALDGGPSLPPSGCAVELDPPVPRIS